MVVPSPSFLHNKCPSFPASEGAMDNLMRCWPGTKIFGILLALCLVTDSTAQIDLYHDIGPLKVRIPVNQSGSWLLIQNPRHSAQSPTGMEFPQNEWFAGLNTLCSPIGAIESLNLPKIQFLECTSRLGRPQLEYR